MIKLRNYQGDAVAKIRDCFVRLINYILLVLPTGGGKTVVFTYMSQQAALKDKKTLILVHRIELLRQTSKALLDFNVEHGMINPLFTPNFDTRVQVASIQTIIKRLNYFAAANWIPDVIIVDEAHHATAGSWRKTINHFKDLNPEIKVIGVTATPVRTDGQGLGVHHNGIFEELVSGPSVKWLQDEGFLVKAKVLSPPKQFAAPKKKAKGDWNARDLENLVNKATITGDAVSHYEEVCQGKKLPAIVFCVSVPHTEEVAQAFRDKGYRFYAIDGTTDDDVRKRVLGGLADGTVDGVCSCDLISEGTDVPKATVAVMLRPTQSLSLAIQQWGRVLRPVYAPGFDLNTREGRLAAIAFSDKPFAYILDHVGNVGNWVDGEFLENHGLPDKLHEWSLDGEVKNKSKKGPKEIAVRVQQCLSCFAVHEPSPVCPDCGHVYEVKDSKPKQVEGELLEVSSEAIKAFKKAKTLEVGMAESLEDLQKIAMDRGYNEAWIGVQYKMKKQRFEAVARRKSEREALIPPPPAQVNEWEEEINW